MKLPRYLAAWLFSDQSKPSPLDQLERDIDAALAARKANRPQRQAASRKGWQTRRSQLHHEGA